MDIEFDSFFGKFEEIEIIGHAKGTFQPYLYEPVSSYKPESSYDNEPAQICPSIFQFEDNDAVPDVSTW